MRSFLLTIATLLGASLPARATSDGAVRLMHEALLAQAPIAKTPSMPDISELAGNDTHHHGQIGEHAGGQVGEQGQSGGLGQVGEWGEAGQVGEQGSNANGQSGDGQDISGQRGANGTSGDGNRNDGAH